MARLLACLRDRDNTDAVLTTRGETYRERLDHLSDAAWEQTVNLALESLDWFPTLRELLALAPRDDFERKRAERARIAEAAGRIAVARAKIRLATDNGEPQ